MPKFEVRAERTISYLATIEADSLEMAEHIADYDLITDDFTQINTTFQLVYVKEKE